MSASNRIAQYRETFISYGIDESTADRLAKSGYWSNNPSSSLPSDTEPRIADSFYGSKLGLGSASVSNFFSPPSWKVAPPEYEVSSIREIHEVLERPENACHLGGMSFRGQTREYFTKRPYPNPIAEINGQERLIIPGYWRKFSDNWNDRFDAPAYRSIFQSVLGDDLLYYGIPNWQTLGARNYERYGLHTMSNLEDFPDPESREYGRRWRAVKVAGMLNPDLPIVEQHYGIETIGLDVTFDISVGAFFAAKKFTWRDDATAFYAEIPPGEHRGVIYCFVFRDPRLTETQDMAREIAAFDHIEPTRPIRQKCALPCFDFASINEAVGDLHCIFRIAPDFDPVGLPSADDLFPTPAHDPFYHAALAIKRQYEDPHPLTDIIEYRFS